MRCYENIVFIADFIPSHSNPSEQSTDFEKMTEKSFNRMYSALQSIGHKIIHYHSPKDFLNQIKSHSNDIIFSLEWSGELSHNRKALIPSICEAYGIAYVGADSYLHMIAQDKQLSKSLITRYGLKSAEGLLINSSHDIPLIHNLRFPIIVKPNSEGGSIGIFCNNLAYNYKDAKLICDKLLPKFTTLIVEEYIPGEEICVCIAGNHHQKLICHAIRQYIGDKTFLDKEIFGAEIKIMDKSLRKRDIVTSSFPECEMNKIIQMYHSFSKAEVMRIDGRLNSDGFFVLELTPDCSLSHGSSVHLTFEAEGFGYTEMFAFLLESAFTNRQQVSESSKK